MRNECELVLLEEEDKILVCSLDIKHSFNFLKQREGSQNIPAARSMSELPFSSPELAAFHWSSFPMVWEGFFEGSREAFLKSG